MIAGYPDDQYELFFGHLPEGILTDTHIHIPGLPAPMPRDPDAWQAWTETILLHREKVAQECDYDQEARRIQKMLCRQPHGIGQVYLACTFGWIYEPREDDEFALMPFILFPRQAEMMFVIDGCMQRPKGQYSSAAFPKARGVGATWCDALDHIQRWLFRKHYQGRLVSRNEDLVDKAGSSDSWMWKFDYILDRLPYWMLPKGYSTRSDYRKHLAIINPETGSAILGEATTSGVGVGGRAGKYSVDEAARIRNLASVWGQLSETTNHRFAISTHNIEVSTDFWDMCHGLNDWVPPLVFEMPWRSVPFRDEVWLEETRKTMRRDLFHREILMDPWAGISTWVYPAAKRKKPVQAAYEPHGGLVLVGIDDGYDDDFAIIWSQVKSSGIGLTVLDSYSFSKRPISYYGYILTGQPVAGQDFDHEAYRLMEWVDRNNLRHAIFCGDRHGDNTDLSSGKSPFQTLEEDFGIHVMLNPPTMNTHMDRRDALSELLPDIDFADTPGAVRVMTALANNRFPVARAGQQQTSEYRKPIHDQTSHLTSAMEYIAVYVQTHMRTRRPTRTEDYPAVRNDMFGPRGLYGRRRSPHQERTWIA